jgi:hypothetical protein
MDLLIFIHNFFSGNLGAAIIATPSRRIAAVLPDKSFVIVSLITHEPLAKRRGGAPGSVAAVAFKKPRQPAPVGIHRAAARFFQKAMPFEVGAARFF